MAALCSARQSEETGKVKTHVVRAGLSILLGYDCASSGIDQDHYLYPHVTLRCDDDLSTMFCKGRYLGYL